MTHRAPGKYYRKGISLIEIFQMFPDDATAEKWFIETRWPDGIHCPYCGSDKIQTGCKHRTMPFRCKEYKTCGAKFSTKSNSVMESSRLGYQVWAVAIYLITTSLKSVSSMKLHRDLKVSQKTAWHLAHRLRKSFEDDDRYFNGIVEANDSYFCGLEKNKHKDNKLNSGRGAVGKKAVAGLKDRDSNKVTAKVIENTKRITLHGFIGDNVVQGSTVCTDDFMSYRNMDGYDHHFVRHSVGEYVDENIHINGMESFWSVLKRAHKGKFHKIRHKHLDRYVTKFAGWHSNRSLDTIRQMENIVRGKIGKQLKYDVVCKSPEGSRSSLPAADLHHRFGGFQTQDDVLSVHGDRNPN